MLFVRTNSGTSLLALVSSEECVRAALGKPGRRRTVPVRETEHPDLHVLHLDRYLRRQVLSGRGRLCHHERVVLAEHTDGPNQDCEWDLPLRISPVV